MGDIGSDYDSAIRLVMEEHGLLSMLDPENEELGYVEIVPGQGFDRQEGFNERYMREGDKHQTQAINRYFSALRGKVTGKLRDLIKTEREKLGEMSLDEVNTALEDIFERRGLMGPMRTYITQNKRPLVLY